MYITKVIYRPSAAGCCYKICILFVYIHNVTMIKFTYLLTYLDQNWLLKSNKNNKVVT